MKSFQKTAISAVAVGLLTGLACASAFAEDAPAADAPEASPITANVTVTNNYIYRGLTQTDSKPAIQGGFDYAHESGLYVGNWNSSISWISDAYGTNGVNVGKGYAGKSVSAPLEMDFYAGFKKELIAEGFASDFGVLQYYYPTSGTPWNQITPNAANPNTTELYVAQNYTFGPVTGFVKFSYAVSTIFGTANSSGSYYPDFTVNYDTGVWGLALNGHVGYQYIAGSLPNGSTTWASGGTATIPNGTTNSSLYSYTDWKLGVTKDFGGGLSGALAYTGTNAAAYKGAYGYTSPNGGNLGKAAGLVSLTKTF